MTETNSLTQIIPRTQKSNLAQARSTQIKSIDSEILESLETYQWRETASIISFAMSLQVSESYLRVKLKALERNGKIESFQEGMTGGKPRTIYRLTNYQS